MKNKIIIGAGILLTVFIVFLIAICGGSGTDKIVTTEELKVYVTDVTCEIQDEQSKTYDLDCLTNDVSFDEKIESKNYTKIIINQQDDFKSFGVSFMIKADDISNMEISLVKNDTTIANRSLTLESGVITNVDLLVEQSFDVSATDEFYIVFSQGSETTFVFDTLLFFFDEA